MKIIPKICPTDDPRYLKAFAAPEVVYKYFQSVDINLAADCITAYVAESRRQAESGVDPSELDSAETLAKLEEISKLFYSQLPPLVPNWKNF